MPATRDESQQNSNNKDTVDDNSPEEEQKCRTCGQQECFVKTSKGNQQKCSTKWIGCDLCREWFHGTCQDLQDHEIRSLIKLDKKNVKWFCDVCITQFESSTNGKDGGKLQSLAENTTVNNKLRSIEALVGKMAATMEKSQSVLNERMEKMESSYTAAVKSNTAGVQKSIEINSSAKTLLARNMEHNQSEARKNNAILYGMKLEESKTAIEQVKQLLRNDCFLHTQEPVKATRLQTTTGATTLRPIKLEFPDEATKWEFLKRVNATQKEQNIFCKLDESKETRDQQYALRQQIREMKATGGDNTTLYRIRSLKIQTKTESGEWVYLNKSTKQTTF